MYVTFTWEEPTDGLSYVIVGAFQHEADAIAWARERARILMEENDLPSTALSVIEGEHYPSGSRMVMLENGYDLAGYFEILPTPPSPPKAEGTFMLEVVDLVVTHRLVTVHTPYCPDCATDLRERDALRLDQYEVTSQTTDLNFDHWSASDISDEHLSMAWACVACGSVIAQGTVS